MRMVLGVVSFLLVIAALLISVANETKGSIRVWTVVLNGMLAAYIAWTLLD